MAQSVYSSWSLDPCKLSSWVESPHFQPSFACQKLPSVINPRSISLGFTISKGSERRKAMVSYAGNRQGYGSLSISKGLVAEEEETNHSLQKNTCLHKESGDLELSELTAISPLDGRYASKVKELSPILSEYGLIRYRVIVEVQWLLKLSQIPEIREVPNFSNEAKSYLEDIVRKFNIEDALEVKRVENVTNHDVKAVEYVLKKRFEAHAELTKVLEFIHFSCTSEDINNLAHALMLRDALDLVILPSMDQLIDAMCNLAHKYAHIPIAAAKAIGKLGKDPQHVTHMIREGVCSVFAKVLKDNSSMKAQTMVAWALSELLSTDPDSQDLFAQSGIIRSLVGHLAFETVPDHSNYTVATKAAVAVTVHSVVNMATKDNNGLTQTQINTKNASKDMGTPSLSGLNLKGKEAEDPIIKASMKAEAARALCKLAKKNIKTCKTITESKALLCFAMLLEKGKGEVQYNSAMAVMEIAAVAEENADLRRAAFKTNSPVAKALVDQLLRIIQEDDPESQLLRLCIRSIGCLARTFPAKETRPIPALVKHLDHRDLSVSREAAIALEKFACSENYLHVERSKAILEYSSSASQLVQLVYFGEDLAQIHALILLCYLALHVSDSEALAKAEALTALKWVSKQVNLIHQPVLENLLPEAKSRLELYQSRGHH